jgi:hypothetical protein
MYIFRFFLLSIALMVAKPAVAYEHWGVLLNEDVMRVGQKVGGTPEVVKASYPGLQGFAQVMHRFVRAYRNPLSRPNPRPYLDNLITLRWFRPFVSDPVLEEIESRLYLTGQGTENGYLSVRDIYNVLISLVAEKERTWISYHGANPDVLTQAIIYAAYLTGTESTLRGAMQGHCLMGNLDNKYGASNPAYCMAFKEQIEPKIIRFNGDKRVYQELVKSFMRIAVEDGLINLAMDADKPAVKRVLYCLGPVKFGSAFLEGVCGYDSKSFLSDALVSLIHNLRPLYDRRFARVERTARLSAAFVSQKGASDLDRFKDHLISLKLELDHLFPNHVVSENEVNWVQQYNILFDDIMADVTRLENSIKRE